MDKSIYEVYHRLPNGTFLRVADVAILDSYKGNSALEKVFTLTNHISENWKYNDDVICHVANPRSTSVGDRIGTPTGFIYEVAPFGFNVV